jgi:hypothetical protein
VSEVKEYQAPEVTGQSYVYNIGEYQVLVMVWSSGTVRTAFRRFVGQTWSAPITPERVEKF